MGAEGEEGSDTREQGQNLANKSLSESPPQLAASGVFGRDSWSRGALAALPAQLFSSALFLTGRLELPVAEAQDALKS